MGKRIDVDFLWIDDEAASIRCPYCKRETYVNIYKDMVDPCGCGKKFVLHQQNWVEEIQEGK